MAEPGPTVLRRFTAAIERRLPGHALSAGIAASMEVIDVGEDGDGYAAIVVTPPGDT